VADLLDAGRQHEAAGRTLDAIAAYTEALADAVDHDLARHVVHLRHLAGLEAARTHPAPTDRDPAGDPFPGVTSLPELGPADLDADVLGGGIKHHGALIVRGLVPRAASTHLRESAMSALAARDEGSGGPGSWYQEFLPDHPRPAKERPWVRQTGGMLTADAPTLLCSLLDLLAATPFLAALHEHLGERPALAFNKCVLRRVTHAQPTWHQDGAFMGPTVRTVDLWVALSDCGEGTGAPGMDLVPRRFDELLPTQTHGAIFPSSIGEGLVAEVAADTPWVTPRFEPGDALVFDDRFVHRTSVGDGYTHERYALEAWFFAPATLPDGYLPILV
jgi:hypothetical protein